MKSFRPQLRPKKNTLLVGQQAIVQALAEGRALDRIYLQKDAPAAVQQEIRHLSLQHQVPVNYVPIDKLNGFNAGPHGGCIALLSKVHYQDLQNVISHVVESGEAPFFLILDGVTDIRNIGGIARTAWSMGIQALIIPDKGVGALNEDAILTSAGALELIPVCRVNSLMKAVDELRINGIRVLAAEMTATTQLHEENFREPVAIVMGGEERGIHPPLLKICDGQFRIPMPTGFESLNVSVATGMILYEAMRQRTL